MIAEAFASVLIALLPLLGTIYLLRLFLGVAHD